MDKPRLKAHLTAEVVGADRVFLLAEDRHYLVSGAPAVKVVPYLDGTHTVADIAIALAAEQSLPQTMAAVRKFDQLKHLADCQPELPAAELAFWEGLGVDACVLSELRGRVKTPVAVVGGASGEPLVLALDALGLSAATLSAGELAESAADLPDGTVALVVTDDYLHPGLAQVNSAMLAAGRSWMLVKTTGLMTWVGPLLRPGSTGCWSCLAQRLDGNRQVDSYLRRKNPGGHGRSATSLALPTSQTAMSSLAAQEYLKVLAGVPSSLEGVLLTFDQRTLTTEEHVLVRQPQCPACGDPGLLAERDRPVRLSDRRATFSADGGVRAQSPQETYDRLTKHVSPLLGAVSSLNRLYDTDNGLTFSYSAGHNFAMPGDDLAMLRRNLRGQSGGKGRTEIQAKVSGICEAIERFSGVWRGDVPVERHAYAELGARRAVHPRELLLFSEAQYEGRRAWNHTPEAGRLHVVPDPFDETRPIDWTSAWSLTNDEPVLVPSGYVWFGHPDLADHFFCYSDANGNAAGNNLEEAVLQGFCELVERDAVAIWWYNRTQLPAVDLDSLGEPYIATLRDYYASIDRDIWVLDLTTELGVPAFAALSHRIGGPAEDILLGFGAHVDPAIAVMRSLTELNQFLPAVVKRNPDGSTDYWEDDEATKRWWLTATLANQPWLLPDPAVAPRSVADMPNLATGDLHADIDGCVELLRAAGLEVLVVDQSRPEIELSVAKVMVPGMRHFWRRLAPGRLYDVPVRMGRRETPLAESELNPVSVFF